MSTHPPGRARVVPLRPATAAPLPEAEVREAAAPRAPVTAAREPLWRHVVGGVLRGERLAQERTLKDVAEAARISMPYLSEVERGRKEASSEVLAAAAQALGLSLADVLGLVQGELERRARAGRPSVLRRAEPPAPAASPAAAPRAPGEAVPDGLAAAEESDDGSATSVSMVRTRGAAARPSAPRPGDVRLAA